MATATAEVNVVVDVTGSDFSAGIAVLAGEPGNFSPLLCGPGVVSGPVFPGQTVYLLERPVTSAGRRACPARRPVHGNGTPGDACDGAAIDQGP